MDNEIYETWSVLDARDLQRWEAYWLAILCSGLWMSNENRYVKKQDQPQTPSAAGALCKTRI